MEKLFIQNRHNKKIAVIVEQSAKARGLVFVMPGLGNIKEETNIQTYIASFVEKSFTAVIFDVTNGVGESEGDYSRASFTGYYNDLVDVITWAKSQVWYSEPFVLAGHSMGGGCILWYAYNYPDKVLGIVPLSTVIGGQQTLAKFGKDDLLALKKDKHGKETTKTLDWEPFKADILKYDIVSKARQLTRPLLMIVGGDDQGTPLEDQMKLFDKWAGPKEIHIIKNAPHTFVEPGHLAEAKRLIQDWIDKEILK